MTAEVDLARLERRYRGALRWYPADWRARNTDSVVGTLLELAEHEARLTPRRGELANLAVNGLAQRVRRAPSTLPTGTRDRVSTGALGIGAAMALSGLVQLESEPARLDHAGSHWGYDVATFGAFPSPLVVVYLLWIAAFLAAIAGFTRTTRWLIGGSVPLILAGRVLADTAGMWMRPTWMFLGLLAVFAGLVLLGRPLADRTLTASSLLWFLPMLAMCFHPQLTLPGRLAFQNPLWLDRAGLIGWMPLLLLACSVALFAVRRPQWATATVLLAMPFTALALGGSPSVRPAATASAAIYLGASAAGAAIWVVIRRLRPARVPT